MLWNEMNKGSDHMASLYSLLLRLCILSLPACCVSVRSSSSSAAGTFSWTTVFQTSRSVFCLYCWMQAQNNNTGFNDMFVQIAAVTYLDAQCQHRDTKKLHSELQRKIWGMLISIQIKSQRLYCTKLYISGILIHHIYIFFFSVCTTAE